MIRWHEDPDALEEWRPRDSRWWFRLRLWYAMTGWDELWVWAVIAVFLGLVAAAAALGVHVGSAPVDGPRHGGLPSGYASGMLEVSLMRARLYRIMTASALSLAALAAFFAVSGAFYYHG